MYCAGVPLESGVPEDIQHTISAFEYKVDKFKDDTRNKIKHLFGVPFYEPERITHWTRLTHIGDFLVNPFADTNMAFDKFSSQGMKLYSWLRKQVPILP